jgi:hypothetical protein
VVLAVLSSRMSAGGCSLAGRRDNVPCLAITAIDQKVFLFFFKPLNFDLSMREFLLTFF